MDKELSEAIRDGQRIGVEQSQRKQINNTMDTKKTEQEGSFRTNRTYYGKVAIVGPSGSGKSYIGKTAPIESTGLINVERKPAPYKREKFKYEGEPKSWSAFMKNLKDYVENPEIKYIIIDSQTGAFNLLNNEMGKNFSGWDIPKMYNKQVYEYFEIIKNAPKDILVLSHDELVKIDDGTKQRRMAVHNREYEAKVEREFTIVLYTGTKIKDNKPNYFLKTFEIDSSTKVPEGMFPTKDGQNELEIPNDADYIFKSLERYYSTEK